MTRQRGVVYLKLVASSIGCLMAAITTKPGSPHALAEITRRAKVSKATVLRVLNGQLKSNYPSVAERHEQIRQLADELNYRPSYVGRTVSRRRTYTIGLLYPPQTPKIAHRYGETIHSLAVELAREGYDLALHAAKEDDQDRTDLFLDRRFDGYVIHDFVSPTIRKAAERAGLPCVTINAGRHPGMAAVDTDDVAGITELTRHLLDLGHRRIMLVSIDADIASRHVSAQQREQGFAAAMKKAGLTPIIHPSNTGVVERLRQPDAPTAVIVHRAIQAAQLLLQIKQGGFRVPDDLSLATFDDTELTRLSDPPMTVMRVPFEEFGREAARMIVSAIEAGDAFKPARRVLLQELIVRESTAAPKRG